MPATPSRPSSRLALARLRGRAWPILQTAAAAVLAWYVARLLLPEEQPVFASIAAVVALGATYGQRPERALELIGGVVLGIGVADLLLTAVGAGPIQLGVLVVLAMGAAVVLGGGPLLVSEAAVSAILLVLLEPSGSGLPPARVIEALSGAAVALGVSAVAFPPNPVMLVGRSAQGLFGTLGGALEQTADALAEGDARKAGAALTVARDLDAEVRELEESLVVGRETARFALARRSAKADLDRYSEGARHLALAALNTRGLSRYALRYLRGGRTAPAGLPDSVRDLALAVWALSAELDDPAPQHGSEVRFYASRAAARATAAYEEQRELALAEIVVQVRSTAVDLIRAGQAGDADPVFVAGAPTEEMLSELAPSG